MSSTDNTQTQQQKKSLTEFLNDPEFKSSSVPIILLVLSIILIFAVTAWCIGVSVGKKSWFPYNKYVRKDGPKGTVKASDYLIAPEHNMT